MKMHKVGVALAVCMMVYMSEGLAQQNVVRAKAIIRDVFGQEIGTVRLLQAPADKSLPTPTVDIVADVEGINPGEHGIHIHEVGSCVPPAFTSAGGHFDPGPFGNSSPDGNHPFHMGDLPNLEVNEAGVGHLRATTSRITLTSGPLSVFDSNGSAIVVHLNQDLGTTGVAGGAGGSRIACGVVELD
jgi:superoxide dismutase, Cu-Zn family